MLASARYELRLAALPPDALIAITAGAMRDSPAANRRAEALLAHHSPPPAVATDLLLQVLPLLRAGAVVVLTFKNTFKKPAPWHEACEAALARLRGPLDGVRSVQLFANTVRECTVLGVVRAAAEAGAQEAGAVAVERRCCDGRVRA